MIGQHVFSFIATCRGLTVGLLHILLTTTSLGADNASLGSCNEAALGAETKTVKIYGAGGFQGLDSYQSGIYVSAEGHVLTVWSTVLDIDNVIVVGSDGRRLQATVVGVDPNLEVAVLATSEPALNFFDLNAQASVQAGERVLAISNLYGIATGNELASIQKGVVMAVTSLRARRGTLESVYQGAVYIIDAMTNNPGAAGGALTTLNGQLIGLLGKELRDTGAGIWINYAIPVHVLKPSVERIIAGKSIDRLADSRTKSDRPASLAALGIVLIPDVLARTPAYIDLVQPNSPAQRAGLQNDDLVLFVNSVRIASQASLVDELQYVDGNDEIQFLVQRDNQLLSFDIRGRE
ncbi:MAG: trypsin-like peptidase domain-containing protein [Planctomycetales bacterium]|nr:trypsin-like peptidase domain-containing protein [Planctomycetales bacterium]